MKAAKDTVSQWVHEDIETKLHANDGAESDQFGRAVAIEGDYAAVGAAEDDNEVYRISSLLTFRRADIMGLPRM